MDWHPHRLHGQPIKGIQVTDRSAENHLYSLLSKKGKIWRSGLRYSESEIHLPYGENTVHTSDGCVRCRDDLKYSSTPIYQLNRERIESIMSNEEKSHSLPPLTITALKRFAEQVPLRTNCALTTYIECSWEDLPELLDTLNGLGARWWHQQEYNRDDIEPCDYVYLGDDGTYDTDGVMFSMTGADGYRYEAGKIFI